MINIGPAVGWPRYVCRTIRTARAQLQYLLAHTLDGSPYPKLYHLCNGVRAAAAEPMAALRELIRENAPGTPRRPMPTSEGRYTLKQKKKNSSIARHHCLNRRANSFALGLRSCIDHPGVMGHLRGSQPTAPPAIIKGAVDESHRISTAACDATRASPRLCNSGSQPSIKPGCFLSYLVSRAGNAHTAVLSRSTCPPSPGPARSQRHSLGSEYSQGSEPRPHSSGCRGEAFRPT